MNRNDLVNIMARAIRDAPLDPPNEVADDAARATGQCRALYLTYTLAQRAAMIRRARWLVQHKEPLP